jgi:hypothetical protein
VLSGREVVEIWVVPGTITSENPDGSTKTISPLLHNTASGESSKLNATLRGEAGSDSGGKATLPQWKSQTYSFPPMPVRTTAAADRLSPARKID